MIVDVGVDGGQSEVRLAIAGRDEVHTSHGVAHSDGDTVALLVAGVADAWGRGRAAGDELGRIVLGLTTLPADPARAERLAVAVADATAAREVWLTGDAVTAHAGALPEGHGVTMVVGTGIACLAIDAPSGRSRRVDGDGYLLGDRGAAFWIGSRGLEAALASADGRGEPTTLSDAAESAHGPLATLAARLHSVDRPVNAVAQFAALVQAHARTGDAIAAGIVEAAAREIVTSIRAGAAIIDSGRAPVAITGRTVSEGSPLRHEVELLLGSEPALQLVPAAGTPLDGACGLAQGRGSAAYEKLITTRRTR